MCAKCSLIVLNTRVSTELHQLRTVSCLEPGFILMFPSEHRIFSTIICIHLLTNLHVSHNTSVLSETDTSLSFAATEVAYTSGQE